MLYSFKTSEGCLVTVERVLDVENIFAFIERVTLAVPNITSEGEA